LGSFSDNPTRYHKEFLHLTRAYALTWGDIYNIIDETLTEDEKERMWKAAEQHTNQLHEQHPNRHPPTAEAVPKTEPQWSYQDGDSGSNFQDHIISCLLAGMDKNSHKQVNYDNIKEITQNPDENPTLFITSWRQ
jgi:replication initiation and membrane attachment protein DnaB